MLSNASSVRLRGLALAGVAALGGLCVAVANACESESMDAGAPPTAVDLLGAIDAMGADLANAPTRFVVTEYTTPFSWLA